MREILRARKHGEAEVLKVALEANGITAVIRGDITLGIIGDGLSVCVLDDEDVARAKLVMKELETEGGARQKSPNGG